MRCLNICILVMICPYLTYLPSESFTVISISSKSIGYIPRVQKDNITLLASKAIPEDKISHRAICLTVSNVKPQFIKLASFLQKSECMHKCIHTIHA